MAPNLRTPYLVGRRKLVSGKTTNVFYTPDGQFAHASIIESYPSPSEVVNALDMPASFPIAVFFCHGADLIERKLGIDKSIIKMKSYPTANLPP